MSDGILCGFTADQIAIGVVFITCDYVALCIHDGHHIALKIGNVIVNCIVVLQSIGIAERVVGEGVGLGGVVVLVYFLRYPPLLVVLFAFSALIQHNDYKCTGH